MSQQRRHPQETPPSFVERLLADLTAVEPALWLIALSTLTIDVYLTYRGLQMGLAEGNPVMATAVHGTGFAMLGLAKVLALGTAGLVRMHVREYGAVIPLGLAMPWFVAVVINVALLWPVAGFAGLV